MIFDLNPDNLVWMKLKFSANINFYLGSLLIFLVLLTGIILRLKLFPTNNTWLGDIGRDMLAGHLIAFKGMSTQFGHYNSGIDFTYPSFYYYFIAFLTIIGGDNYENISKIIIIYQSLGIILVFLIAKNAFSYLPALILAAFYALSSGFVNFSLVPTTAHNSVIVILSSMLLLQLGLDKKNLCLLVFSSFLLILASTFFYGAILLAPFYLLIIWNNYEPRDIKIRNNHLITFLTTSFFFFLFLFGQITIWNNFIEKLFISGINKVEINIDLPVFYNNIYQRIEMMHPKLTPYAIFFYFFIFIQGIIDKKNRKITVIFAFTIIFHMFLYGLHKNPLDHYLIYVQILMLFAIGFELKFFLQKNKLLFGIIAILILFSGDSFDVKAWESNKRSYFHYEKVVEEIEKYFPNSSIVNDPSCHDKFKSNMTWESRLYWYFQRHKPFFYLSNENSQIATYNDKIIFLCASDHYRNDKDAVLEFKIDDTYYQAVEKNYENI